MIFLNLYKSLVRPHLEYATQIWSPLYRKDKITTENVQRRATRLVKSVKHLPDPERLKKLGLPTLEYRRQRADVLQVVKILQGIDNVDSDNFSHYHHIRQLEAMLTLTSYISLEQDSMCDQTAFQVVLLTFGMHCQTQLFRHPP